MSIVFLLWKIKKGRFLKKNVMPARKKVFQKSVGQNTAFVETYSNWKD